MVAQHQGADYSEPEYAKPKFQKEKPPFWRENIDHKIVPETRELLEKYSGVTPAKQAEHVHKTRDEAWAIRTFPCIGLGTWLVPQLCRLPVYSQIVERVQDSATLADIGTFIGFDLRRLVFDGAPSSNLYGIDIADFSDVGFNFFRDRDHYQGKFIEADLLSLSKPEPKPPQLEALIGQTDFIVISQVLHQWDWEGQVKACAAASALTKPGSLVLGNQIGSIQAQNVTSSFAPKGTWRHDPESFAKMWQEIGALTRTQWDTKCWSRTFEEMGWGSEDAAWMGSDVRVLEFVATRKS